MKDATGLASRIAFGVEHFVSKKHEFDHSSYRRRGEDRSALSMTRACAPRYHRRKRIHSTHASKAPLPADVPKTRERKTRFRGTGTASSSVVIMVAAAAAVVVVVTASLCMCVHVAGCSCSYSSNYHPPNAVRLLRQSAVLIRLVDG